MSTEALIPLDINAIQKIGLKKWQDFFYWPISDEVYFDLLDNLWDNFDELSESASPIMRDILLADSKFISFIATYIHYQAVKSICEKDKKQIIFSELIEGYINPEWGEITKVNLINDTNIEKFTLQFKRFIKRIALNRDLTIFDQFTGLFNKADAWSLGSNSKSKSAYLKKNKLYCDHHYVTTLIDRNFSKVNEVNLDSIEKLITNYLNKVSKYCEKFNSLTLPIEEIKDCWLSRLNYMMRIYTYIQNKKYVPKYLILTEVARPSHKVIALALQSKGCKVIGFSHGNSLGNIKRRETAYNEYLHCNIFVCPTKKSASLRKIEFLINNLSTDRDTQFQSIDLPLYKDIHELNQNDDLVEFPKNIMVIGYPMTTMRYQYCVGDFFYFQLDLEIQIIKFLKKNGFRVIYKAHPSTADKLSLLFKDLVDEFLTEPFEKVYHLADALFFGNANTTTFGFAVNTNKPIYLFDIEGIRWNDGVNELLQKRCEMISASFNKRNRIQFNQDDILKKLLKKHSAPNHEYSKQLMFPSNTDYHERD